MFKHSLVVATMLQYSDKARIPVPIGSAKTDHWLLSSVATSAVGRLVSGLAPGRSSTMSQWRVRRTALQWSVDTARAYPREGVSDARG